MNKNVRWCCGAVCALLLGWSTQVWADDAVPGAEEPVGVVDGQETDEMPAYQNAAQAAHDANLAEAVYAKIEAEIAALEKRLEEAYDEEDDELIAQLNEELVELEAERTGIDQGDIARMRADGMGWGEIAHALGVHPGVLGLGHSKKGAVAGFDDELAIATVMDMKTGNGIGHGKGNSSDAGIDNGNNGNNGNGGKSAGKDKSDKANNGNGNQKNK